MPIRTLLGSEPIVRFDERFCCVYALQWVNDFEEVIVATWTGSVVVRIADALANRTTTTAADQTGTAISEALA